MYNGNEPGVNIKVRYRLLIIGLFTFYKNKMLHKKTKRDTIETWFNHVQDSSLPNLLRREVV